MSPCIPSPPLQESCQFARVLEVARGGRAHQQRVRSRPSNLRDLSIIIPNHPTYIAHVARTPSASTDSRCSYLTRVGCGLKDGGRWTTSTAQGPLIYSWGRGPSRGPWWWTGRGAFGPARSSFRGRDSRISALGPRGWGVGTFDRGSPGHGMLLYTCFRVPELVFRPIDLIPTLRHGLQSSQHDITHPRRVDSIARLGLVPGRSDLCWRHAQGVFAQGAGAV